MFSKLLTQLVHLGGIRGHNPPENGVLQHFQQVLSLNIGDTELHLGCSFNSISLKLGSTVSTENWSCIIFGSIWHNAGGASGSVNSRIFRK